MKNHDANTISFWSTCGIKGQPFYSAPKILLHGEYMKSSDAYSFGLVVYEIVQMVGEFVTKNLRPRFNKQINEC